MLDRLFHQFSHLNAKNLRSELDIALWEFYLPKAEGSVEDTCLSAIGVRCRAEVIKTGTRWFRRVACSVGIWGGSGLNVSMSTFGSTFLKPPGFSTGLGIDSSACEDLDWKLKLRTELK